ncbi:MAG: hypothetical protein ACJ74Q_21430 [Pyrinomonadaceae bacterium]
MNESTAETRKSAHDASGGGRRDPAAVERFVLERARPGASNGSAALKAGLTRSPGSARVIGHLLMRDAAVLARVEARRAAPPGLLVAVAAPSVGLTRFAFVEFGDTRELMQRLGGDSPVPLQLVASWDARGWMLERVRASVASHHSHGVWYKLPRGALAEVGHVVEIFSLSTRTRGIM